MVVSRRVSRFSGDERFMKRMKPVSDDAGGMWLRQIQLQQTAKWLIL
jgi:hypothetical protein